jgi:hypothetical protein
VPPAFRKTFGEVSLITLYAANGARFLAKIAIGGFALSRPIEEQIQSTDFTDFTDSSGFDHRSGNVALHASHQSPGPVAGTARDGDGGTIPEMK